MPTINEVRSKILELSRKGLDVVENKNLSAAQKSSGLDQIERQVKHWECELETLQRFEQSKRAGGFHPGALADVGGSGVYGAGDGSSGASLALPGRGRFYDADGRQLRQIAPPSLELGDRELRGLHEAAVERKALSVKATTEGTTQAPQSLLPVPGLSVPASREPNRILSWLPNVAIDRGVYEFYVAAGTSAAAAVAEGATKPSSSFTYAKQQAIIGKVAHIVPNVTEEALADFPAFAQLVTQDMVAGVIDAESQQLLNGNGTAPNLTGLLNTSGVLTLAKGTEKSLETIDIAATNLRTGARFCDPTAVMIHPTTYSLIIRTPDAQGRYLAADPRAAGTPTLWGIPVALTTAMPVGTALLGDFDQAAIVLVREGVRFESNAYGQTDWANNSLTFRAEERLGLAVVRPAAMIKVTGLTVQ